MTRVRLTNSADRRLKPRSREYTVRDARIPSQGVRVHPSGARTFVCHFLESRVTLGPASLMTVDETRHECLRLRSEGPDQKTCAPMFAAFAKGPWRESRIPHCKPSTMRWREWVLDSRLLPNFGHLRVNWITSAHIHCWFDAFSRTSPRGANASLCAVPDPRPCRNARIHLVQSGLKLRTDPTSEADTVPKPGADRAGARCARPQRRREEGLEVDIIRLLLLAGCRKNEIVRLKRLEVDGGCPTLEDCKACP